MQHILELKMMESSLKTWVWVRKNLSGRNPSKNWPFQPFTMVKINFIHFSPDLSNFLQFKPILSAGEDFLNIIRRICQPCTQQNNLWNLKILTKIQNIIHFLNYFPRSAVITWSSLLSSEPLSRSWTRVWVTEPITNSRITSVTEKQGREQTFVVN